MSCCTSSVSAECSPGNLCLGWGCPASVVCALLVDRLCVGCGRLAFVVGVRWMCGRCGANMVWVGVFSLCGCEMISGLLPRIYPHNFVNCISLKFSCTLSIESLSLFPLSSFRCLAVLSRYFGTYVTHFSSVKFLSFSFNIFVFGIIFGNSPFSFIVSPKIIMSERCFFFFFLPGLHKFSCDKSCFNKICTLIM